MGIGKMTIPLYLTTLPEGMTFTLTSVSRDVPNGFWAHESLASNITLPHTFQHSDIVTGRDTNKRGARVGDFSLMTDGSGLHGGQGGSFVLKFTIAGRPNDHPEAPAQNTEGTLTIGTSEWGFFSRPDQTNFSWQIGDQHRTYTAKTPTLVYLDDSCLAIAWLPDQKIYVFGVDNQQDFIVKLMQGGVSAILAGHKVAWSTAAGSVAAFGGVAVAVVTFGAGYIDGI
ncbi:hypothetical protein BOTBODRAFT_31040 [Botryobasidium botryosum FD-172 SS1]|uniref:Uncharacterized protein n=1 Tax=Botryobasidium botryosum (strain FD-172 SS1) TaxID=930990 RepID=A0A067MKT5_BOTB1|nr:hypothetical protein BOTBODRAFT_31040 [Botryobasidium botryosum FD-172 SS1]